MPSFLIDMLLKHLAWQREWVESNKNDLAFTDLRGSHLNYQNFTRRYFKPTLEKAGLRRITPHAMRHSYATALLSAGEPIQNVSRPLGHADPSITLRVYTHVLPESALSTANRALMQFLPLKRKLKPRNNKITSSLESLFKIIS